jgi:hypothetical protein
MFSPVWRKGFPGSILAKRTSPLVNIVCVTYFLQNLGSSNYSHKQFWVFAKAKRRRVFFLGDHLTSFEDRLADDHPSNETTRGRGSNEGGAGGGRRVTGWSSRTWGPASPHGRREEPPASEINQASLHNVKIIFCGWYWLLLLLLGTVLPSKINVVGNDTVISVYKFGLADRQSE